MPVRLGKPERPVGEVGPSEATAPLHLSPTGRGRIAPRRDPGEGGPPGELLPSEAPSPGMAASAAIPTSPHRGEVEPAASRRRDGWQAAPSTEPSQADPDEAPVVLLRHLGEAAPGAVWLGAGMLYRGDDARRLARLAAIAGAAGVPLIAVNDVLYHAPERRPCRTSDLHPRAVTLADGGPAARGQCRAPSQAAGGDGAAVPPPRPRRSRRRCDCRALPLLPRRARIRISRRARATG